MGMKMSYCPQANQIDDYLFNRLGESESGDFEEHYFNCPACFRALEERELLIRSVKTAGEKVPAPTLQPRPAWKRVLRPWPIAAACAALAVLTILIAPWQARRPSWTPPVSQTLRGGAIVGLAPQGAISTVPAALSWQSAAPGLEYAITLKGPGVEWSEKTEKTRIELPAEIRQSLRPNAEYRWQVKAFAPQGYLTANSDAVTFRLAR